MVLGLKGLSLEIHKKAMTYHRLRQTAQADKSGPTFFSRIGGTSQNARRRDEAGRISANRTAYRNRQGR